MMSSPAQEGKLELVDRADQNRYELTLAGARIGTTSYAVRDGKIIIPHTEIDPRHGGRGLGSQMVRRVLDDVRARGLVVVPMCPFVADFIRRHPEYADLLR
jgi:uncharacterized protein